ncbi:MAG: hypothetical protein LQ352_003600 [Teloschistes flavicans]|nr:MAG: hypothetical protein LQ352_003600 [Teloschistes flavicans]
MVSRGTDNRSHPLSGTGLSATSLPSSLLSTKRHAPIPTLSFKSLNPFQPPKSNVSSPGSLFLSPPISSPSLMSPPPRQEGEDYLSLHTSHIGKKRHQKGTPGASKPSPLIAEGQTRREPASRESKDVPDSQKQLRDHDRPPAVLSGEIEESPAFLSLRRLSQDASDNAANVASNTDGAPKSMLKAMGSFFTTRTAIPSSLQSSHGDSSSPKVGLRRRSTAFRDGDRRRPSRDETKKALPGLGVPATITLRKATGLFPATAVPKDITTGDPSDAREPRARVQLTCTLIGFDSRSLDGPEWILGEENEQKQRRNSTFSIKGHDLLASTSKSNATGDLDSRRQSLAETAVTVASIFPSAAILASPAKSSPVTTESERRLSVVQIKSRKSVHQVIWREDDTSPSSSATSMDTISPAHSLSAEDSHKTADGTSQNLVTPSEIGIRASLALPSREEQSLPPDVLPQGDTHTPTPAVLPRRDDQMFGWSWGTTTDLSGPQSKGEISATAFSNSLGENKGIDHVWAASGMASAVPQLLIPDDEDCNPALTNQAPYVYRRASFAIDPSALMTTGAGRELGSRRSISVHPSLLASMGEEDGLDQEYGATPTFGVHPPSTQGDFNPAMAPDLNTFPPSPHVGRQTSNSMSNRVSESMAPPPNPISPSASNFQSREPPAIGPGPLRHPQPLTAADLHLELEKEQEAVVNRLTRELSLLRQQTASVASTTSSTSTGPADPVDYNMNHLLSGPTHPTPSRRHRSSSSLSTRSINTAATTTSGYTGFSGSTVGTTGGVAGSTISGVAPAREPYGPYSAHAHSLSRQNSTASSRRSRASSPSLSSSLLQGDYFPNLVSHRHTTSSQPPSSAQSYPQNLTPAASARSSYLPSSAATARYEETAHHRSEMEIVKRENEMLRRRIRELERTLGSRASSRSHTRSDSASTGNSALPSVTGGQRQSDTSDYEEDAVHVGESAGSVGLGGGH